MSEHIRPPILTCQLAGCMGRRWPDSILCAAHWRPATYEERSRLGKLLFVLAAAVVEGSQERTDQAREAVYQCLAELVSALDQRQRESA